MPIKPARQSILLILFALLFAAALPTAALRAQLATTWVVNTSDDLDDGVCDAVHCSLREALNAAGVPGSHLITFNIPTTDPGYQAATGTWTIQPTITYYVPSQTTIDGSIPVAAGELAVRPGIEIDGNVLGSQGYTGLVLGDDDILRGLIVHHFQYGIWIAAHGVTVEQCYIGVNAGGDQAPGNGLDGILLANGATGALIQHNVISGNHGNGIRMFGNSTNGNIIRHNFIGSTADGLAPLPNYRNGIRLHAGAHDTTIGPGNVIVYNGRNGVAIDDADNQRNTITQNHISQNDGKGIYLGNNANAGIQAPVITKTSATTVQGLACTGCQVEVFSDLEDEGAVFEGTVTAGTNGSWTFHKPAGLDGPFVTAVATDAGGNSSSFSAARNLNPIYFPLWLVD